ncbi:LOW QUALITY PROTEIN: uncharacterized protein LOC122951084 [Acropora millepora]|uniref:LOW QUALITY PROTEIN: uncharacterized protein LOC122951084 n=1 Tax=Acropora millepora TaxID=45264 RepID=UPI001CF263B1|nr:LOW QUALITY PROTEIN: uncharacterized protein LOC122951084 [Acropora millepora]
MALILRFAFFAPLLLPYQCEAMAEDCSETGCLLLLDGDDPVASEFHFKASERGVRLVYINLVIGNASYDPLELPDVFLPHRWVWANTIREPMLSLPDDYDILSLGLLNHQVRSIDVKLNDQPSGCLAKLNSTCQNLAVGRMLLENVTRSISGDILHKKTPVVCVAVISTTGPDDLGVADMWYHCCDMQKEARTGPVTIQCDQRIDVGHWVEIVSNIFAVISFCLAMFAPALPLAFPDYVFSLESEVKKEERMAEQTNMETTGCQGNTNDETEGEQGNQSGTGEDPSNIEYVSLQTVTNTNDETEGEQENQSGTGEDPSNIEYVSLQTVTNTNDETEGEQENQSGTGEDPSNIEYVSLLTVSNTNDKTESEQENQSGTVEDPSNIEYVSLQTVPTRNTSYQEETAQNASNCIGNSQEKEEESKFIPVHDSSPMILSTLLRASFKKFPDIPLSFSIKLAVMSFCVYPCVFYVQIALYKTLKKTSIDEITKKHVLFSDVFSQKFIFVNPTVTYDFWAPTNYFVTAMVIMIIILVLFLRPKDFILKRNEVCPICRFIDTNAEALLNLPLTSRRSLGDEIHLHLNILHHCVWYFLLLFGNILALICDKLLLGRLRKEMHQKSRGRHLLCVGLRLISLIVALPFIFVGGVFCLVILIVILIILTCYLSPFEAVSVFSMVKIKKRVRSRKLLWVGRFCLVYLILMWLGLSLMLLTNSCLFVSNVVAYTIIGLALNVSIVTPILTFLLVLTTNVYLCYAIMQSKYKELKEMISVRMQEFQWSNNFPKDAIPTELYWLVCDKVLPIKSEISRMLRNMVLVTAFLFLALSSIVFFGNEYDISTLTTTISVFFTGSIPPLFLRILTTSNNIIGWEKIKMEREIDEAVKEYRGSRNGEAARQRIAETRV